MICVRSCFLRPNSDSLNLSTFARPVHRAELRAAHAAKGGFLVVIVWKSLVVHGTGGFRVERKGELLVPVEGVAGVRDSVVAIARAGTVTGDVGSVGGDLVGDNAILDVLSHSEDRGALLE